MRHATVPLRRLGYRVLLGVVLLALLAACSGATPTAAPPTSQATSAPEPTVDTSGPQAGGTLRIVWGVDVSLFDPATSGRGLARGLMSPVLQGLTQINPDTGAIEPLLATSWDVSEDGLTWVFNLKEGVVFHDGTPFNAETVVANVDRWLDPEFTHVTRSRLQAIEDVVALDETTVEFRLSRPYPPLPNTMGEGFHYMLSQKDIEEHYLELGLNLPAGTGPFRLTEFVPRERIVMERWPEYAGPRADEVVLDRIVIDTVADDSARTSRLLAGEADLNLYQSVLDVSQIEADVDLEVVTAPSLRQWHFYINANQPHLSDVRVRQALNHAVDQEALVRVAFQGYAITRYSLVPEKHLGSVEVDPVYEYNTATALELLEAAGWTQDGSGVLRNSEGDALHVKLAHTTGGVYNGDQDIASAVAGFWRAIGIEVEEQPMDRGTFYGVLVDENSPNNNEVIAVPFQIDFQDGAAFLDLSFTERATPPACCNFSFYSNADSWAKIEEALGEADPASRAALIEEAQRMMWNDVPVVPGPQLQLVASKVANLNVTLYPNDLHPIAFAYFANP